MNTKFPLIWYFLAWFVLSPTPIHAQPASNKESAGNRAYFTKEGKVIRLGNRFLEMQFSSQNGEIQGLLHKKSGVDLKKEKINCYHTLWGLGVYAADQKRSWTDNARSAEFFQYDSVKADRVGQEVRLHLIWNKITLDNGQIYPATVHATISVSDNSPFSTWRISVQNKGSSAIEKIAYPLISGVQELGSEGTDDCLVVPTLEGRLYHDPARNLQGAGNAYPSCFLNMQFAAYYDKKAGFYLACQDSQGFVKQFSYSKPNPQWASLEFDHYGEGIRYGENFALPYPMMVGVFEGDWYTAADIYRQWGNTQKWAKQTLKEWNIPAWITEIGASSCFVGVANTSWKTYDTSLSEIASLSKNHSQYADCPYLIELWGWENKGAWSWGDYFPPKEGWSNFDKMVADLHASNCRLHVFLGAVSLNQNTDFWKSQKPFPYAARNESGNILNDTMCPMTAFWQKHLEDTAMELTRHGTDMIQFDCFPTPPQNVPCYDGSHGHPLGLGKWQTDAWLKNLESIESACRSVNPKVCFTSEGISEIYIPYMDVAHFWRDVYSEVGLKEQGLWNGTSEIIPLFHYLYHDRLVSQGNYMLGLQPGHSEYNLLCLSRMLVWGEIPLQNTWIKTDSAGYDKNALDLLKRIGQARTSYAKDFLVFGKMLRPVQFPSPLTKVPLKKALGSDAAPEMEVPSVMHTAWRSPDGDSGLIFVNISSKPVPIKPSFEYRQMGLRIGSRPFLYEVRNGNYSILKPSSDNLETLDLVIQPREIILVGLCEVGGPRARSVQQIVADGTVPKK